MSLQSFWNEHKAISIAGIIVILAIIYSGYQNRSFSTSTGGTISFNDSSLGYAEGNFNKSFDTSAVQEQTAGRVAPSSYIPPTPGSPSFGSGEDIVIDDEKVIKTANIDMEVDSILTAIPAIENITKRLEGIILNSSSSEDPTGAKYGYISVKVPVDTFNQARADIKEVGVFIRNENTNARDVTEEFIDIEAQLINLRAQENSYRTLLNRATKIEDILTITNSLTNVRTQIERIEGRRRFLEGQTDFSTINVSLSEDKEVTVPSKKWRPITVIKDAARNTVNQLQGFIENSIEFVFWLLGIIPYLLVIVVLIWLAKRFRK